MILIFAFLNKYIAILRWCVLAVSWVGIAWSTHHIDVLSVKAAQAGHAQTVIQSIPEIVTVTQTITKVVHDAKDTCTNTSIPDNILKQLH